MIDPLINARQPCSIFRGPTRELANIQQQARKLPAGIFAITGAPGLGKTSLLDEFLVRIGAIADNGSNEWVRSNCRNYPTVNAPNGTASLRAHSPV